MATIADLTGETISSSYGTLLMVTNTAGITSSIQTVQDGLGANDSALKLSTSVVGVNGSLGVGLDSPEYVIHAQTADDYVGKFESTDAGASIVLEDNGSTTDGNRITVTSDALSVATANVPALTVDSSQNVGIGASPSAKLDVYSSAAKHVRVHEAGSIGDLQILTDNDTVPALGIKGTGTADLVNVWDGTTEVFTILDGGNVGIGTTDPDGKLEVDGSSVAVPILVKAGTGGSSINFEGRSSDDVNSLSFYKNDGSTGNAWFQSNSTWIRARADGGFHYRNGGTPSTTSSDFTIDGMNVGIGTTDPAALVHATDGGTPPTISNTYLIAATSASNAGIAINAGNGSASIIALGDSDSQDIGVIRYDHSDDSMSFKTSANERMRIDSLGNIVIPTDTSDTSKSILIGSSDGATGWSIGNGLTSAEHLFQVYDNTDGSARLTIDTDGRVGIGGTIGPTQKLDVVDTNPTDGIIARLYNISDSGQTGSKLWFGQNGVANWEIGQPAGTNAFVICDTTSSELERMRIDSSGNVLVKTIDVRIGSDVGAVEYGTSTANSCKFFTADDERMRIDSLGIVTITNSNSGLVLKNSGASDKEWRVGGGGLSQFQVTEVGVGDRLTISAGGQATFNSSATNTVASFESTDSGAGIKLTDPTGSSTFQTTGVDLRIGVDEDAVVDDSTMSFRVDGSTKMQIDSLGNVIVANMPTSDPAIAGALFSDGAAPAGGSATLKISGGPA